LTDAYHYVMRACDCPEVILQNGTTIRLHAVDCFNHKRMRRRRQAAALAERRRKARRAAKIASGADTPVEWRI
jgi:hypothetical protein